MAMLWGGKGGRRARNAAAMGVWGHAPEENLDFRPEIASAQFGTK